MIPPSTYLLFQLQTVGAEIPSIWATSVSVKPLLAYGSNGFTLTEVAHMLGISAPTVCSWKRRYVDGGIMEIPEIPPEEVANAVGTDLEGLGEEQLKAMVRELELKNAALEETVNASEGGSIDGLTNAEKALAVDALVPRFGVTDSLRAMRMASSSYYYIRRPRRHPTNTRRPAPPSPRSSRRRSEGAAIATSACGYARGRTR